MALVSDFSHPESIIPLSIHRKKKNKKEKRENKKKVKSKKSREKKMLDGCMRSVRARFTTKNELKGEGYHKDQSRLSSSGGHSVRMTSMCM